LGLHVHFILGKSDFREEKMYQHADVSDFLRLYNPQIGRGLDDELSFYKSSYKRQRGAGLGAIFGSIARTLLPFAKNYLLPAAKNYLLPAAKSYALSHGQQAIKGIASDVLSGRNVRETIKEHGQSALKGLKEYGQSALKGIGEQFRNQSGSGRRTKRKRRAVKKIVPKKKRKINQDLF